MNCSFYIVLRKSGPITSRKLPTLYLCEFSYISVFLDSFLSLKARYTGRSLFTRYSRGVARSHQDGDK